MDSFSIIHHYDNCHNCQILIFTFQSDYSSRPTILLVNQFKSFTWSMNNLFFDCLMPLQRDNNLIVSIFKFKQFKCLSAPFYIRNEKSINIMLKSHKLF